MRVHASECVCVQVSECVCVRMWLNDKRNYGCTFVLLYICYIEIEFILQHKRTKRCNSIEKSYCRIDSICEELIFMCFCRSAETVETWNTFLLCIFWSSNWSTFEKTFLWKSWNLWPSKINDWVLSVMLCFGSVFRVVLWICLQSCALDQSSEMIGMLCIGSVFIADWYVVLWIGLRVMVHNGETIVQTLIQLW